VGDTVHNVGGLACILGLTNSHQLAFRENVGKKNCFVEKELFCGGKNLFYFLFSHFFLTYLVEPAQPEFLIFFWKNKPIKSFH